MQETGDIQKQAICIRIPDLAPQASFIHIHEYYFVANASHPGTSIPKNGWPSNPVLLGQSFYLGHTRAGRS